MAKTLEWRWPQPCPSNALVFHRSPRPIVIDPSLIMLIVQNFTRGLDPLSPGSPSPVGRIPLLRPRRALPSNFVVVPRSKSFTCRPIAYRMSLSALYRHNCGPFAPTASNPQVPAGYCGYVLDGVKSISARSFHCRRLPIVVRFLSSPPGRPHQTIVIQRCAQSITHWLANMSQKMPKSRWLFSFGGMAQTALTQFLNGPMEYLIFTNSSSMKYSSL
jgi:hypothetical protein